MHRLGSVAVVVLFGLLSAACADGEVGVYPYCVRVPGADDGVYCERVDPGPTPTTTIPRLPSASTTTAQPNFALAASPEATTVPAGGEVTFYVTISRSNFGGDVDLSVSGLPSGTTASFDPDPAPGAASYLTVSTSPKTPRGTTTLTITGTGGSMTRSTAVTLTVTKR